MQSQHKRMVKGQRSAHHIMCIHRQKSRCRCPRYKCEVLNPKFTAGGGTVEGLKHLHRSSAEELFLSSLFHLTAAARPPDCLSDFVYVYRAQQATNPIICTVSDGPHTFMVIQASRRGPWLPFPLVPVVGVHGFPDVSIKAGRFRILIAAARPAACTTTSAVW